MSGVDLRPPGATRKGGGSSSDATHRICGFIHNDGFSDLRVGGCTGGGQRQTRESNIATVVTPVSAAAGPSRLSGPGVIPSVASEGHANIEDVWKTSYNAITEDILSNFATSDEPRQHARDLRGISARSLPHPLST
ncbi:hypothetical protein BD410DRAFT_846626 [Rickenella mellea]|uniref:Uncharacterized protein n=1 Tax=Rickenella mellea TaxID=50990 RepID=A0A4Y7PEU1_9AGAM|nr:hypothetical protein BD410DRAFT_846626 [Rickenella mellea]